MKINKHMDKPSMINKRQDFNIKNLEYRAAIYYKSISLPKERWFSIDDLAPQIMEFEHYVNAEAYNEAALVLNEIDFDYLTLWGHGERVIEMRKTVHGRIKDERILGQHLSYFGYAQLAISNYKDAINYSLDALSIQQKHGYAEEETFTLGNLGRIYHQKGELKKSKSYYQQAISKSREIKKNDLLSVFLANLAIAEYMDGNYLATINTAKESVELAESQRDKARAFSSLGLAYQGLKDFEKSEDYLLQALRIAIEIDDFRSQSFRYGHLGNLYFELGKYQKSLDAQNDGYISAEKANSSELMGARMLGIGRAHFALHANQEAETILRRSIELCLEIDNKKCHTEASIALIQSYLFQNKIEDAEKISNNLLEENSTTKFFEAVIYARLRQYTLAKSRLKESLSHITKQDIEKRGNFNDQYMKSLILLGLWLLTTEEDKSKLYKNAEDELKEALSQNSEKGTREYYTTIVQELQKIDEAETGITPLLDMLQND